MTNRIWSVVYLNANLVELELLVVAPSIPEAHQQATDWLYPLGQRGPIVSVTSHRAFGILMKGDDVTGEAVTALSALDRFES